MAVLTGKSFTFTWESTDYSAVVTSGGTSRSGSSETVQTLAGVETVSQGVEDTASVNLLYDGSAGLYSALFAAAGTGTPAAVTITGGDGQWTGDLIVTSVGQEFDAGAAATCSAELAGALTFAAKTAP